MAALGTDKELSDLLDFSACFLERLLPSNLNVENILGAVFVQNVLVLPSTGNLMNLRKKKEQECINSKSFDMKDERSLTNSEDTDVFFFNSNISLFLLDVFTSCEQWEKWTNFLGEWTFYWLKYVNYILSV
ncbi:hypothetical protein J0S82_002790 [Galemys pyrenaicus]|uniref:Uncharacterized protein n=1 Tax=Galemys pyrenaicus TaxID=202257 RepID=A0A8J5ZMG8_GALPY|nr:hypothetical protein J0S82_002790 [Galemys pyrenaicus]